MRGVKDGTRSKRKEIEEKGPRSSERDRETERVREMKNKRRQIREERNRDDSSISNESITNVDIDQLRDTKYYWQQKKSRIRFSSIFYSYYSYFCRSIIIILISVMVYFSPSKVWRIQSAANLTEEQCCQTNGQQSNAV